MEFGLGKKLLVSAVAFTAVVGGYLFWQNRHTDPIMISPVEPAVTSRDSAMVTEIPKDSDSTPIFETSEGRSSSRPQRNQQTPVAPPPKEVSKDEPEDNNPPEDKFILSPVEPTEVSTVELVEETPAELIEPSKSDVEEHLISHGGRDLPFMQVWGGLGVNYISFGEDSNGGSNTGKFANLSGPTVSLGVNVRFAEQHRGQFEYHDWPGTATADNSIQIDRKDYRWKNILAEYQYIFSQSSESVFTALAGVQIHQVPFIIFNNDGSQTLSQNELRNLSLGIKWQRFTETGFEYSALARYQHILDSGSTDGINFEAKSGKIIDASVGVSRRLKNNMTFGFFWLGQYQNFDFDFSNSSIAASGNQTLFNSNFQIRIGYDFF
jgi:hypothetical protein